MDRIRTNHSQFLDADYDWTYVVDLNGNTNNNTAYSIPSAWRYSAMKDTETPDYHQRSMRGEIILSGMRKLDFDMVHRPVALEVILQHSGEPAGKYRRYIDYPIEYNLDSDHIGTVDSAEFVSEMPDAYDDNSQEAVAKAWANVDESELLLLTTLGELPETIRWIASIYRRSIAVIRLFNRKGAALAKMKYLAKSKSKLEMADLVSSFWLEYRYAFRPLVFDMVGAINALNSIIEKRSRCTGRGYKHVTLKQQESHQVTNGSSFRVEVNRNRTVDTTFRAGVLYQIQDDLSSLLAVWGLDQPFESAWDLVPFSFIVDWFFNVGDVISSWSIGPGLLPLGSWVTAEKTEIISDKAYSCVNTTVGGVYTLVSASITESGYHTYQRLSKQRLINPPKAVIPSIKLNLDLAKIFDLAAIARALYLSGGRVKIGGSNVR